MLVLDRRTDRNLITLKCGDRFVDIGDSMRSLLPIRSWIRNQVASEQAIREELLLYEVEAESANDNTC